MKPLVKKHMLLRSLVMLVCFFPLTSYSECILKIRVNDVPPQYMLKDGKWVGRAVELMETLLDEAHCKADYQKMPWQRALWELEKGKIDGMMNVVYSKERAKHFHFIRQNTIITTVLFMRKDTIAEIHSLDDLVKLPKKIGYENGNMFDSAFVEKFASDEHFRKAFSANPASNLTEMVFRGRLSAELTIFENAHYAMKTTPKYMQNMQIHPFEISSEPALFAFSKRTVSNDRFIELYEANIRAIAKGKYQEVIKKWAL